MIWDQPHKHVLKKSEEKYTTLQFIESKELFVPLELSSNKTIQNLFKMTPYYRKAPKEKQEKILALEQLSTHADFIIDIVGK